MKLKNLLENMDGMDDMSDLDSLDMETTDVDDPAIDPETLKDVLSPLQMGILRKIEDGSFDQNRQLTDKAQTALDNLVDLGLLTPDYDITTSGIRAVNSLGSSMETNDAKNRMAKMRKPARPMALPKVDDEMVDDDDMLDTDEDRLDDLKGDRRAKRKSTEMSGDDFDRFDRSGMNDDGEFDWK